MVATLLRLALLGLAAFSTAAEHPIASVITLLGNLKKQAEEEGFTEEQAYEKYEYWCQTSLSTLEAAIAKENEKIDSLETEIDGLKKEEAVLEEEIEELGYTISNLTTASQEATSLRSSTASAYTTASDNLKATIKAIDDSLAALEASEKKTEPSLAQEEVRKVLALLHITGKHLNVAPNLTAYGDREAHVDKYDFKSENVIEILKQLKAKFEDDLTQATTEETNSLNAFQLAEKARTNEKAAATKAKGQKETTLGEVQQDLSTANQALIDEKADLEADTTSHGDTDSACKRKAAEWDERSKTRTTEIKAMDAAVEILSKVSGVRSEASNNPKLGKSPWESASLLEVAAEHLPTKQRAVELIRAAARKSKSHALDRLAVEVASHLTGPFDEVNNMIQKMIFHLEKEQTDEDAHKDWCDLEIEKTTKNEGDRTDKIGLQTAKINELDATINTLTSDIAAANAMISKLNEFMKEATEIREAGKMENSISLKDAVDAQTAIANAVSVLETFYKESGAITTDLLQAPVELPANPDTWDSSYTGVADPKKQPEGIISILETTAATFSEMEAQTKAQEETDQKDYQEAMKQSKVAVAERTQEVKEKEDQKTESIRELDSTKDKKKRTEDELEQWKTYMKDLQPACVEGDSTYAERKQARSDEIEALKTAQTTLAEAFKESFVQKSALAFLQVRRHIPSK